MHIIFRRRQLAYLQLALIIAALVTAVVAFRLLPLERIEAGILGRYYALRGPIAPSPRLAIVAIDDASLAKLGPWPWPKKVFADLITSLRNMGASAIGLDTTFAENALGDDKTLLNLIEERRDTVVGISFYPVLEEIPLDKREWAAGEASFDVLTTQMLASAEMPEEGLFSMAGLKSLPTGSRLPTGSLGFTNVQMDDAAVLNSIPLVVRYRSLMLPSMGLALAARADNFTPLLRKDRQGELSRIALGQRQIAVEPSGSMVLNLKGPAGTYPTVSAADLLAGNVPREAIEGKIVLVGALFKAPRLNVTTAFGAEVPAIEVWANAVDNMLSSTPLTRIADADLITIGIVFVLSLLMGLLLPRLPWWSTPIVAALLIVAIVVDGYLFFARMNIWFAVIAPLITVVLTFTALFIFRLATEERRVKGMRGLFTGFVAERVIRELANGRALMPRKGERRQLTAMTVGIRNFAAVAEEMPHEEFVGFMRDYLGGVADELAREDAYVQHMGNDHVLAIFGAPAPRADHVLRACRAALGLRQSFSRKKGCWTEDYKMAAPRLSVGVFTGPMVAVDLGLLTRHGFTALGVPLMASEALMRLNRTYRTSLIVSPETVHAVREMFIVRPLDLVRIKNVKMPFEIYELMGPKGMVTPYLVNYLKAYDAYRARQYEKAATAADEVLARLPHDGPSQLIRERAHQLMKQPPAKGWDGAWLIS